MSTDLGLERALTDLGAHLDYPPTPPLAETVLARIAGAAGVERALRPARWRWPRRWPRDRKSVV